MLFNFTMRKTEQKPETNQVIEPAHAEEFNFDSSIQVDDEDALQPMSLFEMSRIRGGRTTKSLDRFNTSCGGIIPQ
jgi:hypothetical protein